MQGASIKSVVQKGLGENARLVMVVHPLLESRLRAAVELIGRLDFVRSPPRAIRVIEEEFVMSVGLIDRFRDRLPFEDGDPVVTLGEGSTPLVHAPHLSERVGAEVWLKLEGANPTGLVQGPRHDLRGVAPPCARAPRPSSARRRATPPRARPPTRRAPG